MREVLRGVARVDDHHDAVGETIDEAVVLDRAAVVEDGGVVDLADGEGGDIVRRDVVDEVDGTVAGDPELAHVRDVEDAASLAHGLMLGSDSPRVLDGHLVAGEVDDLSPQRDVDVVEGRALERGCGGVGHSMGYRADG